MVRNLIIIAGVMLLFGAIWAIKDEKISKSIKVLVSAVLVAILCQNENLVIFQVSSCL